MNRGVNPWPNPSRGNGIIHTPLPGTLLVTPGDAIIPCHFLPRGQVLLASMHPSRSPAPTQRLVSCQTPADFLASAISDPLQENLQYVGMETLCGFAPSLIIARQCVHTSEQALVSRSIFAITYPCRLSIHTCSAV